MAEYSFAEAVALTARIIGVLLVTLRKMSAIVSHRLRHHLQPPCNDRQKNPEQTYTSLAYALSQ